jgi:hypothetical protein
MHAALAILRNDLLFFCQLADSSSLESSFPSSTASGTDHNLFTMIPSPAIQGHTQMNDFKSEPLPSAQDSVAWHQDPAINRLLACTIERDWGLCGYLYRQLGSVDRVCDPTANAKPSGKFRRLFGSHKSECDLCFERI